MIKRVHKCVKCKGFKITKINSSKYNYCKLVGTKPDCSHVWRPGEYSEVEENGLD